MRATDGALARQLDFGESFALASRTHCRRLRLAPAGRRLVGVGPDKYKVLEHRRRQAQIKARHLLGLMDPAS